MRGAGQGHRILLKILQLNLRVSTIELQFIYCNEAIHNAADAAATFLPFYARSYCKKVTSLGYPLEPTCTSTDCVLGLAFDK